VFRTLATLRVDAPVFDTVDDLRWKGPRSDFEAQCRAMAAPDLFSRAMAAKTANAVTQSAPGA
jgi:hypothetical protein